LKNGVIDSILS
jgi:gamma-aminobutyric acid receptor subunit beta